LSAFKRSCNEIFSCPSSSVPTSSMKQLLEIAHTQNQGGGEREGGEKRGRREEKGEGG